MSGSLARYLERIFQIAKERLEEVPWEIQQTKKRGSIGTNLETFLVYYFSMVTLLEFHREAGEFQMISTSKSLCYEVMVTIFRKNNSIFDVKI